MTDVLTDVVPERDVEKEALAAGLLGIDAARRVGWAKAFEALRRVESLEEETRQMRDELKYLRRAYSRLLGFVENAVVGGQRSSVFDKELGLHLAAEATFRVVGARRQGVRLAREHIAEVNRWDEQLVQRHEEAHAAKRSVRGLMLKNLNSAARELGHVTHIRRRPAADKVDVAVSCSCGEKFVVRGVEPSERDGDGERPIHRWRNDHLAQVAFQCEFADYKRRFLKGEVSA